MAVKYEPTKEQREAQGRIVTRIFNLENADNVTADWLLESFGSNRALLRIELIQSVDLDTANALLNGRDDGSGGIS